MCCFNKEVHGVSKTKIFVMPTKNGRQVTVYDNNVSGARGPTKTEKDEKQKYGNAMILPCPLKKNAEVGLIDLSKDNFSFKRMKMFFPEPHREMALNSHSTQRKANVDSAHLEVHTVGAYFISIAKTVDDLSRVDPSVFKVSDAIDALFRRHYAKGFGFIICCFDPSKGVSGHPIAYEHDLMPDGTMFVPCRHEHGHGTKETESFSHEIYSLNSKGEAAGQTRTDLGWKGDAPVHKVPFIAPKKPSVSYVPKPLKELAGGGIATTDVKCPGCSFFGGISGHCSKCWKSLSPEEQHIRTEEQKLLQPERDRVAFEQKQKEDAERILPPHNEAEAIQSEVLSPYVPEIKSLRQRSINGLFKNDDLYFSL
jgi:hypothetical protein